MIRKRRPDDFSETETLSQCTDDSGLTASNTFANICSIDGQRPMTYADASGQVSREEDKHVPSRELGEPHPRLRQDQRAPGPNGTTEAPVEHLDLATVIKVMQAGSSEVVREKVLETERPTARNQPGAQSSQVGAP